MQVEHRSKRFADGSVEVRLLMSASAELDTQAPWPKAYIQRLNLVLNGELIFEGQLEPGLAPDPFFTFKIKESSPGDRLEITWLDTSDKKGQLVIRLP
ncbi:MAG: hypothetical protein AXA67_11490 [Methylothermaceae bacteria B42]|nr:MAG: hypothetical protein AXA67_11490 [Methylothermaceae bacteria B42]HHJ39152.1 hypothetical protein [Methylothermaceae bacterium]